MGENLIPVLYFLSMLLAIVSTEVLILLLSNALATTFALFSKKYVLILGAMRTPESPRCLNLSLCLLL